MKPAPFGDLRPRRPADFFEATGDAHASAHYRHLVGAPVAEQVAAAASDRAPA